MEIILISDFRAVSLECPYGPYQLNQTKPKMKNLIKTNVKKGFSLVELLVVIAVIGVIAAIAIPAMSGIFGKSEEAKTKRNAQNIASVYAAAKAAGNTQVFTDKATALSTLTAGGLAGSGAFTGSSFVAKMGTTERDAAGSFLSFDATNGVTYTGTGL